MDWLQKYYLDSGGARAVHRSKRGGLRYRGSNVDNDNRSKDVHDGMVVDTESQSGEDVDDTKERVCCICMDESRTVHTVFLNCRHMVCCDICARAVEKCPVCRAPIVNLLQVYT
uniref:E3 ubiquitin-protein ligase cblA n=1 Tax=Lygus hesperus TaxID=30085 RepID=A0A0A9YN57_LYGHE